METQRLRTVQHSGRIGDRLDSPCGAAPGSPTGPIRVATAMRLSALERRPGRLIGLREALGRAWGERRPPVIRCVAPIEPGEPQCA